MSGSGQREFVQTTRALRVVFSAGATARARDEIERLGARRALLVTTPRGAEATADLQRLLGGRLAGVFGGARLHVPAKVVRAGIDEADRVRADGLVAVGGGSAVGAAKAIAVQTGLPILALPTTYSGSEMTSVWGVTEAQGKRTGRDPRAAPRAIIYDPLATLELPPDTSAASGVNALAHAVEALYAPDAGPLAGLLAEEGIRALVHALPRVVADPRGLAGRSEALYGAHLSGWALDLTSMGLHHKLCHVVGGSFDLPHALVHAILLPHVVAFNQPAAPGAMARIDRSLGGNSPARSLFDLNRTLGITTTLAELGLGPAELDRAAELAMADSYPNPRRVDRKGVREILARAAGGIRPDP